MSLFSKFTKSGDSVALGIDIGSSAIKVVQIKKKNGQAVLDTYGELALGPYAGLAVGQAVSLPPDKIAQALTDLMKEKEVNITTNKCGISIPFGSSLMSEVEMPDVGAKQLASMVPIEARKYIPVPISEVMLDWSIIPKTEARPQDAEEAKVEVSTFANSSPTSNLKKVDVLIVAIHQETIARYQEIVAKSGLDAGFFEIEIFSTQRSVLDDSLRPVMIIDMGAASTKIYVIERGVIRASHTINRGSQDITSTIAKSLNVSIEQAEIMKRDVGATGPDQNLKDLINMVLSYIFTESNNALLAFEKKYNKAVSKVVLVGGGSALKGFAELAKNNFKASVSAADPFSKVTAPAFLANILKETGPEFAVAIGLALRKLSEEG